MLRGWLIVGGLGERLDGGVSGAELGCGWGPDGRVYEVCGLDDRRNVDCEVADTHENCKGRVSAGGISQDTPVISFGARLTQDSRREAGCTCASRGVRHWSGIDLRRW